MSGRSGTRTRPRRSIAGLLGAVAMAAGLVLAGCGSNDSGGPQGASDAAAPAEAPAGVGADESGAQQGAGLLGQPVQDPATDPGVGQRAIVYTGSITVRVKDVDGKAAEAARIATGAGGFVGGDNRSSDTSAAEATLQLRVPADRFAGVVDQLAGLGETVRRDIKTDDVTEETLDLDARIATQRARVDSGRRLLAQAKSLADLVMLEGELAKREADLASLEAKKRRLADLTALSTITANLLGPNAQEDDEEPATGFLAGLKGGWEAFVASLRVLLTVLGALLPWIIGLGLPVLGVLWLVRRLRARRSRPVPATPPVPVPAQMPASTR
ncbi:DUF4349 domain-containing protein [Plantactinospora sp. S1510]|uniref:DUF4349 domain-containing protein n=1 Tax=Plantactinospora alkalitolerans TaxID=2789879 RepID=A0ABS0GPX9_9ACTN|nr:DUF4349 domain-containing protein [Plantactinospora alkalitolerans]MBF9128064.1 DUF4349 domain-containing protein [Plantactinospora alkalitolerans]